MSNVLTFIKGIFSKIDHLFNSEKVQKVETVIATYMPEGLKIVQEIDQLLGGNKTIEAVINVANKYGIPLAADFSTGGNVALNNALLNIATQQLSKVTPNLNMSILNAIVNAAVALVHA